ncbi:MAG TPA: ATP-binding protein [Mycobacteriales bacterium]|nr:ATP-binding protein [Mycobacteriales bacterium]
MRSLPYEGADGGGSEAAALSAEQLRTRFPDEGERVEFKQGVSADRIAEAVTAFSNTAGGTVLVGVGPDGRVIGTNTDGEARSRLHRIVSMVSQPGRYLLTSLLVGASAVLAIDVEPRRQGFAQTRDGRVLVRRGAMNVALLGEELAEFVSRHALHRFERTPLPRPLADADPGLLAEVCRAFGWSSDVEVRLGEIGLAATEDGQLNLTVAGALYLIADPGVELGKAYIEVFRYRDDGATEDKRRRIEGPLHHQVAEATAHVLDEIGRDVVVLGLHRYELDRLPREVLRETVANAVAHRVYEDNRRAVRIEVRPNRVVVTSPGPLPEPVRVETMRDQSAARNIAIISVLRRFRLAEDAGRGVDLIQDQMAAELLDEPQFSADEASVTVTLPLTSAVTATERAWVREVESRGELRHRDRVVLVHAARGAKLTNTSVRQLLGIDSTHARAALQRLRDAGFLDQQGQRSGARYVLSRDITPPAGLRLERTDARRVVLGLAAEGPLTNQQVRQRLALDRVEALRLLRELVASGDLDQVGSRRGTRYVLRGKRPTNRNRSR